MTGSVSRESLTRFRSSERGLSLIEAIAGTAIAIIAVLGLAYSFGVGRGLIDRYRIARIALALAERRMEMLAALPADSDSLQVRVQPYGGNPFNVEGRQAGFEEWIVSWHDDPIDNPGDLDPHDLKFVNVRLTWTHQGSPETVSLTRLFENR